MTGSKMVRNFLFIRQELVKSICQDSFKDPITFSRAIGWYEKVFKWKTKQPTKSEYLIWES